LCFSKLNPQQQQQQKELEEWHRVTPHISTDMLYWHFSIMEQNKARNEMKLYHFDAYRSHSDKKEFFII